MFAVNGEGRKASAETRDETRFRVGLLPAASGGCVSVLLFATPHLDCMVTLAYLQSYLFAQSDLRLDLAGMQ